MHPARQQLYKPNKGTVLNSSHPLARGLRGAWVFNENVGEKVFDYSREGNTALAENGVTGWTKGGVQLADQEMFLHDGKVDVLDMYGKDMSVVWSCEVTDIASDFVAPISQFGGDNNTRQWATIYNQNTGGLDFYLREAAALRIASAATAMTINTIDTRAIVFRTPVEAVFYKDGQLDATRSFAYTMQDPSTPGRAVIGAWSSDTGATQQTAVYEFRGYIYYMYVYDRILTADEVALIYREPYAMFQLDRARWFTVAAAPSAAITVLAAAYISNMRRREGSYIPGLP